MKVALSIWGGRISPVFDVCREALIFDIQEGDVVTTVRENVETPCGFQKVDRFLAMGVEMLICGAITRQLQMELESQGLRVIGFVKGEVDEVLEAFIAGTLPSRSHSMPGCGRNRRRFRGGRDCRVTGSRRRHRRRR